VKPCCLLEGRGGLTDDDDDGDDESDGWEMILGFAMRERARRLTIGSVRTFVSDE
jgi:hypothetical protein